MEHGEIISALLQEFMDYECLMAIAITTALGKALSQGGICIISKEYHEFASKEVFSKQSQIYL